MNIQQQVRQFRNNPPSELIETIERLYNDVSFEDDPFVQQMVSAALEAIATGEEDLDVVFEAKIGDQLTQEDLQTWWLSDWKRRGYDDDKKEPSFLQQNLHDKAGKGVERILNDDVDFNEQIEEAMSVEFKTICSHIEEYARSKVTETETETNEH